MTISSRQLAQAETFQQLHRGGKLFVLANAWDVASGRLFEMAGYKAIGSTSAGISATLGYPDGQHIGVEHTAEVVKRLAERTNLPISADIEAGYSDTVDGVVTSVRTVIEAGAVGINIEDSTGDESNPFFEVEVMTERIAAIRKMADVIGLPLVINTRCDLFMLGNPDDPARLDRAIERGKAYRQAGADCIFVPDIGDLELAQMKRLVVEISAPINIIAGTRTPSIDKLDEVGVSRVSLGPRHMRIALAMIRNIAVDIMETGSFRLLGGEALSYSEVNEMLK